MTEQAQTQASAPYTPPFSFALGEGSAVDAWKNAPRLGQTVSAKDKEDSKKSEEGRRAALLKFLKEAHQGQEAAPAAASGKKKDEDEDDEEDEDNIKSKPKGSFGKGK